MEKRISKNDMKWLKKYEMNFKTATKSDYARNVCSSDLDRMKKIMDEALDINYDIQGYCASCQLRFLKEMGKLYFRQLEYNEPEPTLINKELQKKATNKGKNKKKENVGNEDKEQN